MHIAEIIEAAHPPRAGRDRDEFRPRLQLSRRHLPETDSENVREAARTMFQYLRSLGHARFTLYGPDLTPILLGEIRDGRSFPHDLEQRLLEPTATGFEIDVEILGQHPRWLSVVYPAGAGPAKRVIRWPRAPNGRAGRPWTWGLTPGWVRRRVTSVADLIAGASDLDRP